MQVVAAACVRRPLVADEGSESPRLVVLFRDRRIPRPQASRELRVHEGRRQLLGGLRLDQLHDRSLGFCRPGGEHSVPLLDGRVFQQLGIAALDLGDHTHAIRVIGNSHPVQGLSELDGLTARGLDFLTACKSRRVLRSERRPEAARIHGPRRVHVLIAEVRALRVASSGVWGIARLFIELGGIGRLDLTGVGRHRAGTGRRRSELFGWSCRRLARWSRSRLARWGLWPTPAGNSREHQSGHEKLMSAHQEHPFIAGHMTAASDPSQDVFL